MSSGCLGGGRRRDPAQSRASAVSLPIFKCRRQTEVRFTKSLSHKLRGGYDEEDAGGMRHVKRVQRDRDENGRNSGKCRSPRLS